MRQLKPTGNNRYLMPVVHIHGYEQTLESIDVAFSGGADGVFLIDHKSTIGDISKVLNMWEAAKEEYSNKEDFFLGINFLQIPTLNDVFREMAKGERFHGLSMLWSDNVQLTEEADGSLDTSLISCGKLWKEEKGYEYWNGVLFGSYAFKGQDEIFNLKHNAKIMTEYCSVIVTSGPRTGQPADVQKVIDIRDAIGPDFPLALASGVSIENVKEYLPHVNIFMVASSLQEEDGVLIQDRIEELYEIISSH